MKMTTRVSRAVLAAIALLSLSALSARAADPPGFETYIVRHGDTLSKIAGRIFGDVKRWREILKENPQVKNPNLIFPGDSLLVPVSATAGQAAPSGVAVGLTARPSVPAAAAAAKPLAPDAGTTGVGAAQTAGTGAGAGKGAATAVETPAPPVENVRKPKLVSRSVMDAAGYFADALPALAIVSAEDDRMLLGGGDAAIVNAPVAPGKRFSVVRAERRVFHPRTGAYLGWLIRVLGTAESTCRGERTSTVALRTMRDAASIGDYLVPAEPAPPEPIVLADKTMPECILAGSEDGFVVSFDEDRLLAGERELAYIDRGTATGAAPGRVFIIYRDSPFGPAAVGSLQVIRAGERTAAAVIINSLKELQVGDLLRAQ